MPTYDFRATASPKDLVAELNLSQGQYAVQNVDRTASVLMRESVSAPSAGELGIRLAPGDAWTLIVATEPVWAWSNDAGGCSVVING